MEKIKALLKQLNASDELANQIVESMETYVKEQRTVIEGEYKTRLAKAKQVCLEETNRYKADLSKKVQLFFETRAERIEQQMAKQVAIRESAAEGNLKQIKALLEGIQLNAQGEADLQALKTKVAELQKQMRVVSEQRDRATQKANFAHGVAEKALKRNRNLEAQIAESKVKTEEKPIVENKTPGKTPEVKPIVEPVKKQGAPSKVENAISEGTLPKRKSAPTSEQSTPAPTEKKWDPNTIAAGMAD